VLVQVRAGVSAKICLLVIVYARLRPKSCRRVHAADAKSPTARALCILPPFAWALPAYLPSYATPPTLALNDACTNPRVSVDQE
jgi:hypothetical protein